MIRRLFLFSIFILLTAQTCAPARTAQGTSGDSSAGMSYQALVDHLRSSGLKVESAGQIEQPFFTPKARVIRIGTTGEAQVYEYATEEQAGRRRRQGPTGRQYRRIDAALDRAAALFPATQPDRALPRHRRADVARSARLSGERVRRAALSEAQARRH